MRFVNRYAAFVLRILRIIFNIGLIYLILMSCNKIHYYVSQIQTSQVYPYTYQRVTLPNGQPLFRAYRRRYDSAQTLRLSN